MNRTKLGHQITPHMEGRATFETSKNLKFRQKSVQQKKLLLRYRESKCLETSVFTIE